MALAEHTRIYEGPKGTVEVWFVSPSVMVFKWTGAHSVDSADFMWRTIDSVTGAGIKPTFYVDLESMTTVDNIFRMRVSECVIKTRAQVRTYNFFIKSKIIGMLVSVVNLGVGGNLVHQVFSERRAFEEALRKEAGQIAPIDWPAKAVAPRTALGHN